MITIQLRPVGVYHVAFSDGCCTNTPQALGVHLFVMKTICEMMSEIVVRRNIIRKEKLTRG